MDALFEHCHPDCEFRPAATHGEVLHSVEAARVSFREHRNAGADRRARPRMA